MAYEYDDFLNDQERTACEFGFLEKADEHYDLYHDNQTARQLTVRKEQDTPKHEPTRTDLMDQLTDVEININLYTKLLEPGFYSDIEWYFRREALTHKTEIHQKCKEFWMRKFNRILKQLKY